MCVQRWQFLFMTLPSSLVSSVGEPDSPVLSADQMQVERNTLSIPLKQVDDGGTPLQVFKIQYKEVRDEHDVSYS